VRLRGSLEGLCLRSGRLVATSLVFFSVAREPRTELATFLGCRLDEEGFVLVEGQTSVEGVYAAGDLTPGPAAGPGRRGLGGVAGVGATQSLFGAPGTPSSPAPSPEPTN